GGRLVVAVQAIVAQQPRHPAEPDGRCGVDLGIGLEWAVIAHHDGTIERVAHPVPWKEVHQQQRRLAREVSRRTVGSRAHRHAKTKRAALDQRAVNLRRQAIHVLTTRLARRYGTVVVEGLDVAAMQRSMGRQAFRRTVSQAGIGQIRPTLAYKCPALGGRLVLADRWYGSSKSHHDCGGYRADLKLGDRVWNCPRCGRLVDRNANAALNLRDWTGAVDIGKVDADGDVQRGGVAAPVPRVAAKRATHGGQAHAPA
ncbi:MAG: RNA-guided endonuclease InsQ/TnpB family protein, partial [Actinomycetes bacterium]